MKTQNKNSVLKITDEGLLALFQKAWEAHANGIASGELRSRKNMGYSDVVILADRSETCATICKFFEAAHRASGKRPLHAGQSRRLPPWVSVLGVSQNPIGMDPLGVRYSYELHPRTAVRERVDKLNAIFRHMSTPEEIAKAVLTARKSNLGFRLDIPERGANELLRIVKTLDADNAWCRVEETYEGMNQIYFDKFMSCNIPPNRNI